MFRPAEREALRDALVAAARDDPRVSAAALTGSAALEREDRWSDVDLALSVEDADELDGVVDDWTARMYDEHDAVHHVDVWLGATLFRVFLIRNTLQVDIAYWPAADFGALGPSFRLLFGSANERPPRPGPHPVHLIGMSWLYALHARSSIARERPWQAEYMLSAARDQVLALAALRHGEPTAEARGTDGLPGDVTRPFEATLVGSLDREQREHALHALMARLRDEIRYVDDELADGLEAPLAELGRRQDGPG
jgi:predicted nucleotidyltransferase